MDDLTKRAQEALEGATEGPWQPGEALTGAVVNWHLPASHPNAIVCQEATEGDAFFIAEARHLVPDMLARIEADAARLRELEEMVSGDPAEQAAKVLLAFCRDPWEGDEKSAIWRSMDWQALYNAMRQDEGDLSAVVRTWLEAFADPEARALLARMKGESDDA